MYNIHVKKIFQFLKGKNFFIDGINYNITANEYNYSLIMKGNLNFEFLTSVEILSMLEVLPICYYQINDFVIIENKFIDQHGILKNIQTFTQRDDNIRNYIHEKLKMEANNENIVFIGGEMYIYAKILDTTKSIGFTDTESIKIDTEENSKIEVYIIDYTESKILDKIINFTVAIINIFTDIPKNLIEEIEKSNIKKLFIISCKGENKYNFSMFECQSISVISTLEQKIYLLIFIRNFIF